jgi:imidazolonepropionase-like amidohydrolase
MHPRRHAVVLIAAVALLAAACGTTPGPASPPAAPITALVGGRVQPSPDAAAIPDGVVLIDGATISAVGPRGDVGIPPGATVIDCAGATITAGFWNSHVHFMQPVWNDAATAPAERLAGALRAMLTSHGVVNALDIGSFPANTGALRDRVASGEIPGPAIMMATGTLAPEGGSPFYVLPARLPEVTSAAQAASLVEAALERGADGIKLFTGSFASPRSIVVMPLAYVRAAAEAAHRRGKFVIAHPSNSAGARVAIEGGVDILAHTFPAQLDGQPWDRALPGMMVERRMALVPTLKVFPTDLRRFGVPPAVIEIVLGNAQAQLRAFAEAGGQVLFGSDVGYMADHDPTDEYVLMQGAGLSYPRILASLTTAPAERFGAAARAGRVARGLAADVVVVDGDPERDIRALAKVRYTLRAGRVIYARGA